MFCTYYGISSCLISSTFASSFVSSHFADGKGSWRVRKKRQRSFLKDELQTTNTCFSISCRSLNWTCERRFCNLVGRKILKHSNRFDWNFIRCCAHNCFRHQFFPSTHHRDKSHTIKISLHQRIEISFYSVSITIVAHQPGLIKLTRFGWCSVNIRRGADRPWTGMLNGENPSVTSSTWYLWIIMWGISLGFFLSLPLIMALSRSAGQKSNASPHIQSSRWRGH